MPVIWLIDAYRAGERSQVRALANALSEALDAQCETKVLDYRKGVFLPHILGQSTLRGITAESARRVQAPWPDIVITCGVRNEPVCRWIKAQSQGRCHYIHVGKPWGPLDSFDLVVTTPQYRVPEHPNVLQNTLTLHGITPEVLAAAKARFAAQFADLPRPHYAVIVGGDSGPFTLGPKAARRLAEEASRMARARGGSVLCTTSSRTSGAAVMAIQDTLDGPHFFYPWRPDDADNPYLGILAHADRLWVTGDSIAMLSEACATGKPVQIFDLGGMRRGGDEHRSARDFRLGAMLYAGLMRWFWQPLSRDITLVHDALVSQGYAAWSDQVLVSARVPEHSELQRTVAAVRQLLEQRGPSVGVE